MNKAMRTQIDEVIASLEDLKETVSSLADEEREKFDNLTEGLQAGERGQRIEEAAAALEGAGDSFDEIINYLEEAKGE